MAHKIQIKRGNKADLPVLNDGELGLCLDTNEVYVGNNGTNVPVGGTATTARFVIGTSTAGWTSADCDYLCDGTADQVEINNAITALPATGGEIVILDGTYNITAKINVTKNNVSIRGNGNATILKRMFNSSAREGVITLTSRSGCKIANLQVDGNKTSYNNSYNYGIYLVSSSNNTVACNTCNNSNSGINISDSSSNNTITGNTCNNNSYGIYLYASSNNTVTGNIVNNNSYGIYLTSSSNNTVTGNIVNNNSYGIYLYASSNNTVTGNTCIRGTGLTTDYTTSQHTIRLSGTGNSYNLISNNNCMGKAVTNGGGTGNTLVNNKFDDSDDIQVLAEYTSDANTCGLVAKYTFNYCDEHTSNTPYKAGLTNGFVCAGLITFLSSTLFGHQICQPTGLAKQFIRTLYEGTWSPWFEFYSTNNVTISTSAPSSALAEGTIHMVY